MRLHVLLALAVGAALVLSGCTAGTESSAASDDEVIRFATLPLGDDPKATTPVAAVTDLLEAETGTKVEVTDVIESDTVIAFADPASSSGYFMPAHMLTTAMNMYDYGHLSAMVICIIVLVTVIERASAIIRRKII